MASIRQNVQMWAGDSFIIRIALVDEDGASLELGGGATARWWAGKSVAAIGSDIYVQKSTSSGIAIETSSGQSTLVVSINPADTVSVPAGNHYHEAEVIDGATVSTVATGRFAVIAALIPPAA